MQSEQETTYSNLMQIKGMEENIANYIANAMEFRLKILEDHGYNSIKTKSMAEAGFKRAFPIYFGLVKAAQKQNVSTVRSNRSTLNEIDQNVILASDDDKYSELIANSAIIYSKKFESTDQFLRVLTSTAHRYLSQKKKEFPNHFLFSYLNGKTPTKKIEYKKHERLEGLNEKKINQLKENVRKLTEELCIDPEFFLEQSDVTLDSIVGYDDQKEKIAIKYSVLKNRDTYLKRGKDPKKVNLSTIIFGPQGTGKTTFAYAIANEYNLNLYSLTYDNLFSKWLGESEKIIKYFFSYMVLNEKPGLLFIDEIDGYAKDKAFDVKSNTNHLNTLLQILSEKSIYPSRVPFIGATSKDNFLGTDFWQRMKGKGKIKLSLPDFDQRYKIVQKFITDANKNAITQNGLAFDKILPNQYKQISNAMEGFSGRIIEDTIESLIDIFSFYDIDNKDHQNKLIGFEDIMQEIKEKQEENQ